jgi:hypothetical protein
MTEPKIAQHGFFGVRDENIARLRVSDEMIRRTKRSRKGARER